MRSRVSLFALIGVVSAFALPLAAHAAIPFFGPIIPAAYNVCPASWGLLITVINNIISFLLTMALVFIAPLTIAYAGFLFVVNPVNANGISEAKGLLWNTVLGLVVAFAGWLIVAAIMAVLYHPSGTSWGAWSDIIYGRASDTCLRQKGALPGAPLDQAVPQTGVSANGILSTPPANKTGTACDPAVVLAGAAAGGYTLSVIQANIFACIAQPESQCGAPQNPPNYNWNSARSSPGSSAAGAFQVLLSTNHLYYENKACYAAVGLPTNGSTKLNCHLGFDNLGNPKTDSVGAAKVEQCLRAANNLNCSISTAANLLLQNGGNFSPWQADVNSARQTGCITTGG